MAESLMQMYETLPQAAQQELYEFALFLVSRQESVQGSEKTASERFFEAANAIRGNSNGEKWTREELYER